jgi:hypothetical protein
MGQRKTAREAVGMFGGTTSRLVDLIAEMAVVPSLVRSDCVRIERKKVVLAQGPVK